MGYIDAKESSEVTSSISARRASFSRGKDRATPRAMNLVLTVGDAGGEVDAHWDSLYKQGVKSYEVQTALNPVNNDPITATWRHQPTVTKSKAALTGFTPGARIWVRIRGIGPAGSGEWCDPATSIVP